MRCILPTACLLAMQGIACGETVDAIFHNGSIVTMRGAEPAYA